MPTVLPAIVTVLPSNSTTNIPVTAPITVTFNKDMDAATLNTNSFTVTGGGSQVSGNVMYSNKTATFTPTSALSTNTYYTIVLTYDN